MQGLILLGLLGTYCEYLASRRGLSLYVLENFGIVKLSHVVLM